MNKHLREFLIVALFCVLAVMAGVFGLPAAMHYAETGTFDNAYRVVRVQELGENDVKFRVERARSGHGWSTVKTFFVLRGDAEPAIRQWAEQYMDELVKANGEDETQTVIKKHP